MSDQQQPPSSGNPPQGGPSYGQSGQGGQSHGSQPPSYGGGQGQPPSYGGGQGQPPSYGGGGGQPPSYGGGGYGQSAYPPPAGGSSDEDGNAGPGALFDFSFKRFGTNSLVKPIYILAMVLILLYWLGVSFAIMDQSTGLGVFFLIVVGPLVAFFSLAMIRITLEFYVGVMRMRHDVNQLRDRAGAR